jgi:hypothetical protein
MENLYWRYWRIGMGACVTLEMRLRDTKIMPRTPKSQYSNTPFIVFNPLKYIGNVLAGYWLIGGKKGLWLNGTKQHEHSRNRHPSRDHG